MQEKQCVVGSQSWPLGSAQRIESTVQGRARVDATTQLSQQYTCPLAHEPESWRERPVTGSSEVTTEAAAEEDGPPQPAVGAKCGAPLLKAAYTCSRYSPKEIPRGRPLRSPAAPITALAD